MRPLGNYAFGEDLGSVPTRYNPYRYAASYRDQESAGEYRYYMTARYHDTEYGRFTQADYWEPGFLTPQALTPLAYQYVGNNPLIYNDPTGHLCWGCLRRAVVVTGIVVTASLVASTGLLAIVGGGMTLNFMEDSRVLFRVTSDGTANTLVDLATNGTYTSTTQWYHVVATYDGATATARLCVNGVNDGTLTSAPSAIFGGAIDVAVSGYDTTGSSPFNGVIDEVRIYSRALSASEVQARYLAQPENEDTLHYYLGGKQVAFKKGGTLYFPLQDHLKGTAVITNSAGSVVESTTYYPYGQTRSGGITSTDRAFTGQRLDSTGLYYYGARYYDPNIGRFVSPDTIVQNYRRPASFNRYAYAFDNPLKYTDPSGHVNVSDVGGGGWRTPSTWDRIKHGAELAVDGAKSAAAGGVQFAATVTEVAVRVSQPVLQRVEPVANVVATVPEVVIEHTAVPVLNATGAGITNVELNPARGYVGVQVSEGGWVARTLEATTGGLAGAITLPVAGPSGSVVIVREELFTPEELETVTRHEEIHVTQQHMLGPLFLPLYFLGSAVHGYEDNPFEVQARSFSTPPPVNGVDIVYDEFA